jgi:hypothetical protein
MGPDLTGPDLTGRNGRPGPGWAGRGESGRRRRTTATCGGARVRPIADAQRNDCARRHHGGGGVGMSRRLTARTWRRPGSPGGPEVTTGLGTPDRAPPVPAGCAGGARFRGRASGAAPDAFAAARAPQPTDECPRARPDRARPLPPPRAPRLAAPHWPVATYRPRRRSRDRAALRGSRVAPRVTGRAALYGPCRASRAVPRSAGRAAGLRAPRHGLALSWCTPGRSARGPACAR